MKSTARIVRLGWRPSPRIRRNASIDCAQPAPSSCAPGLRSQLSMWPPTTMTSSGFSVPRSSPMTLCDVTGGRVRHEVRNENRRPGSPRSKRAQAFGRRGGDGHRRDLRRGRVVAHRPGVRVVVEFERQRPHDRGDGSNACRGDGAARALLRGAAVGRERVEQRRVHRAVEEDDPPARLVADLLELGEPSAPR